MFRHLFSTVKDHASGLLIVALLLAGCATAGLTKPATEATLDGFGVYYEEPQHTWLVFTPGTLPTDYAPYKAKVCEELVMWNAFVKQQKLKSPLLRFPLKVAVRQWVGTGDGPYTSRNVGSFTVEKCEALQLQPAKPRAPGTEA